MNVWFSFKHDVHTEDSRRYICARVSARQPPRADIIFESGGEI